MEAQTDAARSAPPPAASDGLAAELRDSLLLLLLSVAVTVGLAGALSVLLSALA